MLAVGLCRRKISNREIPMNRIARFLRSVVRLQRINIALTRGGQSRAARVVDDGEPASWEFSGFSQNGEDGIIDYLLGQVASPNKYFVEIGASDGLENNTTWLAMTRRYSGMWVEGNAVTSSFCNDILGPLNNGVESINQFCTAENVPALLEKMIYRNPDVFSLDVDGTDFYLARGLFGRGFKPKICVVEYNSAFGPDQELTIPYITSVKPSPSDQAKLYYGCSIAGWRKAFASWGYHFVTVDSNGVNAFFVDPAQLSTDSVCRSKGAVFAENFAQHREHEVGWAGQWEKIKHLPFAGIEAALPH